MAFIAVSEEGCSFPDLSAKQTHYRVAQTSMSHSSYPDFWFTFDDLELTGRRVYLSTLEFRVIS